MTWFKENKFLAVLIGITTLIAAFLIFLGMRAGSNLEAVQAEISDKQSSLQAMKTLDPYPTIESAEEKRANLVTVLALANEAREKLLAFRPESMANVPGKAFSENLSATVSRVKELFPTKGALPKSFNLGFESYTGRPPKENATGVLTYELGALEYLFKELAAAGVTEVQNLSRAKLPAEDGKEWPNALGGKKGPRGGANRGRGGSRSDAKRGRGRGKPQFAFAEVPPVAHRLPFELVFKAPEAGVREFLTQIANSNEYFFETRVARVLNPAPIPSAGKTAVAAKPKENAFEGGFVIEGAEPVADTAPVSEQILNKVSGGNELVIYLRADLLLFMEEQKFPELK